MKCRKNVKNLTDTEKRLYVEALYALREVDSVLHPGAQSRYDDYVEIHRDAMSTSPDPAHGDSAFFPWHRELLWQLEQELGIRVPYWDWTRAHDPGDDGYPFTYDFLGPNGDPADSDRVKRDPGADPAAYPHAFDPEDWDITVKDGGEPDFLQRSFGTRSDAPSLPENDTAVTGTSWAFRQAIDDVPYETHRSRSESIHNLVHRWCNGNMITASSPNDPVFFLHHAAIDRMWSLWQGRNDPSVADRYVNTSGATGHVEGAPMVFGLGTPPWPGTTNPEDVVDGHAMHGDGVWYDTDLPEISLESGLSLAFDDVPEGLTAYRAVRFRVQTCRPTRFRITAISGAPYALTSLGSEFVIDTDYDPDPVDALVWVQFDGSGGDTTPGSVEIEAYIVDDEGYYTASEGDELVLGTWTITLTSEIVPRVGTSIAMVLDRSGSMAAEAGGAMTRSELMRSAVSVFHALLDPGDEIGLVGFDDVAVEVLAFGPASAGLGTALDPGGDLDPRGTTGIGLGVEAGAAMLAGATHAREAMLVLTDGNENVHPYVDELPAGTVTSSTYAIGFGLPGHVSDDVLNRITTNTGGDLVITGELHSEAERFLLTKYFLQILAGVQSQNVVLDPEGALTWGARQVLDIPLSNADTYVDVIALCPLAPWLDLSLVTPGGDVIDVGSAAGMPNVTHVAHPEMQAWRLVLPADPAKPSSSHGGTWKAVFSLRKREHIDLKSMRDDELGRFESLLRGAVPWSCLVHATSNVTFDARALQTSFEPGAPIDLQARLLEYQAPFAGRAHVWAEIVAPDGSEMRVELEPDGEGTFAGLLIAGTAGLHRIRVRATGYASAGERFTREKTLSAGIFLGGDRPVADPSGDTFCRFLRCALGSIGSSSKLARRLKRLRLDRKSLERCLRDCERKHREPRVTEPRRTTPAQPSSAWLRVVAKEAKRRKVSPAKPQRLDAKRLARRELFPDPDGKGASKKDKYRS